MKPTNKEAPTSEENVPLDSPKNQKEPWYKSEIVVKWVSAIGAVCIPLVIWFGSCQIQQSVSEQSAQVQYVGLAISILDRPKQESEALIKESASVSERLTDDLARTICE